MMAITISGLDREALVKLSGLNSLGHALDAWPDVKEKARTIVQKSEEDAETLVKVSHDRIVREDRRVKIVADILSGNSRITFPTTVFDAERGAIEILSALDLYRLGHKEENPC